METTLKKLRCENEYSAQATSTPESSQELMDHTYFKSFVPMSPKSGPSEDIQLDGPLEESIPVTIPANSHPQIEHVVESQSENATPEKKLVSNPMRDNMLEVCIDSLESAINAIHGGADELEVCSSLAEGGLTPSVGLVKQILQMVNNLTLGLPIYKLCKNCPCGSLTKIPKVNVMIRCRSGSDFCYTEQEMDTMLSDIAIMKPFGVDRFVFGALTSTQNIDNINCKEVIEKASPIPVTFHRAFDLCVDPIGALEEIILLGFNRLLTSGQSSLATDDEAMNLMKMLLDYDGTIQIMPGAGVNANNAKSFIDIGCRIIHSSCKVVKYLPKVDNHLSMGTNDKECFFISDEAIVRETKAAIAS